MQTRLIDNDDSTKSEIKQKYDEKTPCRKRINKRSTNSVGSATMVNEVGEGSITKPPKINWVNIEKDD